MTVSSPFQLASVVPDEVAEATEADVLAQMPETVRRSEEALARIPGQWTRFRRWPFPLFVARGEGPFVFDLADRKYVDCVLGFGTIFLGHGHPAVLSAVRDQLQLGTQFAAASAKEADLHRLLIDHVPGGELAMLLVSGTDATMGAMRIARAATGKPKVAKCEGGWNGWGDQLAFSLYQIEGPINAPRTTAAYPGLPPSLTNDVITLPFNDDAAIDIVRDRSDELAGIIVEALQIETANLEARPEWLHALQRACRETGVLFVLDEVMTGFRVGPRGAAGLLGLEPDLATFAKLIGGGLPLAAIVGREDLIEVGHRARIGGTFSESPLLVAAGLATLQALTRDPEATYGHVNDMVERLADGLLRVCRELNVPASFTHLGPMWELHFSSKPPQNIREMSAGGEFGGFMSAAGEGAVNRTVGEVLWAQLALNGVIMGATGALGGHLSVAHGEAEIDTVIAAHHRAIGRLQELGAFGA